MEIDWRIVNLYSLPFVAALIGWFTNYVAVKMLFRPRNPVRILGITFQGLVPRRQADLAEKIADTVEENLISHRDVQNVLQSDETKAEIERIIECQIDIFLREKLNSIPMVGMFLQGEILTQIKGKLVAELRSTVPVLLDSLIERVESNLDFRKVVREKVESFDLLKLESIIYGISAKELRTIEILGGVLGFVVGLVQLALLQLTTSN